MQKHDFKLSDFYASWIYMNTKLTKSLNKHNTTRLAEHLLKMLAQRKQQLLNNPTLISALALDPRFCNELDENQKETAITTLVGLWDRLQFIKNQLPCSEGADCSVVESDSSSDDDITISNTTILKEYMKRKSMGQTIQIETVHIREKIATFLYTEHHLFDGTVLDFWNNNQDTFPELYVLAKIIFAISPTQAMVERSFSTMKIIFNERRSGLSKVMLDDIHVIALNNDLFHAVNMAELNSLQ